MIGSVAAQRDTAAGLILHHCDCAPAAHGGLLCERDRVGGWTVREVHPADLPWVEQRQERAA